MGKKTPTPPPAPDPVATAQAQGVANLETAIGNTVMGNANEYGPGGSVTYQQTGGYDVNGKIVPTFTRRVSLGAAEQGIYDKQNEIQNTLGLVGIGQANRVGEALATPLSTNGLPASVDTLASQRVGSGPQLATGFGQTSQGLQYAPTTFGDAGAIQRSVGPNDFSADRERVEQALYDRVNPGLQRDRSALETQLVNQGLTRGSTAFNAAMDEASRRENDARLAVTAAGGQEQSRLFADSLSRGTFANTAQAQDFSQQQARGLFGLGAIQQNNATQQQEYEQIANRAAFGNDAAQTMYGNEVQSAGFNNAADQTAAQFQNTARERALQEAAYIRGQPLNDTSALLNGLQVQMPQFSPYQAGQAEAAPIAQSIYNSAAINQQSYQTKVAAQNAKMQGLFGLAGSIASAGGYAYGRSDIRLKTDIRPLGIKTTKGFSLYRFRYRDDPTETECVGVMAQEVVLTMPGAVGFLPGGYLGVDYGQVL